MTDNARRFLTGPIDAAFLRENGAVRHALRVDWIVALPNRERKLVAKTPEGGEPQLWHVEKETDASGGRTVQKRRLEAREYRELLALPIMAHLEKTRHELTYLQGPTLFSLRYDEFPSGGRLLEVDAPTAAEREGFDPAEFPYPLQEVTGDRRYEGYRIVGEI
jgi:hypothetical protein